jgi:hypothetical protein
MSSMVMIRCPTTGAEVATGIICDWQTFNSLSNEPGRVLCPACKAEHAWARDDAWLAGSALSRNTEKAK